MFVGTGVLDGPHKQSVNLTDRLRLKIHRRTVPTFIRGNSRINSNLPHMFAQIKFFAAGRSPLCLQALACPPSARFGRLGFLDHIFCKHSIHLNFLHPIFANKKLKTHLREHSRQSPVPKIRSCFLSEFSVVGRTRFFLLSLFRFFPFSSERKRERNE